MTSVIDAHAHPDAGRPGLGRGAGHGAGREGVGAGGSNGLRGHDEPQDLDGLSIVDRYIRQQQTMTAVDRFARSHEDDLLPAQARYYRDLIPLTTPRPGEQYAFEVDLDSCSGCKACVSACHNLNGLDDGESFRAVGTLVGDAVQPWQQTITAACHHCVDPACLNGCPVDAYEKDPITGIVKHLDDQCIGCSYCTLTCPYEVPQFNADLGIVRKCDLCSDRLAVGEAPACVQACPTSAISVTIVEVAEAIVAAAADDAALVPTAPPSRLTVPTTRYRSAKPVPANALPVDHFSLQRSHAHPPLTIMLVLTQLAVGAFVLARLVEAFVSSTVATAVRPFAAGLSLGVGLIALLASTLHLGRPQYAWRAVIGLRHSWLSREIVAFGAFAGLALVYAGAVFTDAPMVVQRGLGIGVSLIGAGGVACSALIYAVTYRTWWRLWRLAPKFVATALITGAGALMVAALVSASLDGATLRPVLADVVRPLALLMIVGSVLKLGAEASIFRHLRDRAYTDLRRTAMLLTDDLRSVTQARFALGVAGGVVLPLVLLAIGASAGKTTSAGPALGLALLALLVVTAGELCERWQFFTAVTAPRMPGVQP
jgi:Fe-S-cluster-containing dehydrogenase component/DMSO reductase anchor subunit